MAEEKLQINSINNVWAGASGAVGDIDEAVSAADGNLYGPGPQDDTAEFGVTATSGSITDAATITNIDIEVRVLDEGTAGSRTLDVVLVIDGIGRGISNTGALTGSLQNITVNNAGWDSDWTKAQLDGAEIRLNPRQSGMPGTNVCRLDCAEIIITFTPPASANEWTQEKYRFRDDNGSEVAPPTGADWLAAEDTPVFILPDTNFRLRFLVQETGGAGETEGFQLQRRLNGGAWGDVNASSTIARTFDSTNLTDGGDTTEQMAGSQTFITNNNGIDDVNGEVGTTVFAANEDAEYEFSIQLRSANTKYGDKVEFQLVEDGGADLGVYTVTAQCWLDAAAVVLRQVEQFTVTFASGSASETHTLATTLLDVDAAFLVYGCQSSATGPQVVLIDGVITNTTTVTFTRNATGSAQTLECYVTEFTDGVRVERGSISSAEFDAAPSALVTVELANIGDITKAWVFSNHEATGGTVYDSDDFYSSYLTEVAGVASVNAQNGNTTSVDGALKWEVIQYAGCAVQRGSTSMGTTTTSVTDAISAVDLGKTFLNASWILVSSGTDISNRMLNGKFNSNIEIFFDRTASNSTGINDIRWEVVEFTDDVTVEEIIPTTFGGGDSTKNETITAVTEAIAFAAMDMSHGKMSAADVVGESSFTAEITTSTNLQLIRGASAGTANAAFYVVDFGAAPGGGGRVMSSLAGAGGLAGLGGIAGQGGGLAGS